MKRISIIGSNSYIARNAAYVLGQTPDRYECRLYDRQEEHADGRANYRRVDMLSKESVRELDLDCDIIFMFTGKTGSANGFSDYDSFLDINERALLNLLHEYGNQGSRAKIIFPSTRLVYKGCPGELKEDAQKEFKTVYAINKFACEQYLEMFGNVFGVRYCVFRICVPYGTMVPGASSYGTAEFMLGKAANREKITLYGDGGSRRTLTYIGDLCECLIRGALSDACVNDVFNIGGEDYSLKEMAEMTAARYGVEVEYVPWPELAGKIESGDTVFDSEKLDRMIGKQAGMNFQAWLHS